MALHVSIDLTGFRRLRDETVRDLGRGLTDAVRGGLDAGAAYARRTHAHQRQTGRLTGSELHARIDSSDARGAMGALVNDTPYAKFVEYGTRPHRIYPKNGRYLKFNAGTPSVHGFDLSSETVFARFVNHPGTKPLPFMRPAFDLVAIPETRRRMQQLVANVAKHWK
jgi:hypothetical protein